MRSFFFPTANSPKSKHTAPASRPLLPVPTPTAQKSQNTPHATANSHSAHLVYHRIISIMTILPPRTSTLADIIVRIHRGVTSYPSYANIARPP